MNAEAYRRQVQAQEHCGSRRNAEPPDLGLPVPKTRNNGGRTALGTCSADSTSLGKSSMTNMELSAKLGNTT